jgi:hypothetical protein
MPEVEHEVTVLWKSQAMASRPLVGGMETVAVDPVVDDVQASLRDAERPGPIHQVATDHHHRRGALQQPPDLKPGGEIRGDPIQVAAVALHDHRDAQKRAERHAGAAVRIPVGREKHVGTILANLAQDVGQEGHGHQPGIEGWKARNRRIAGMHDPQRVDDLLADHVAARAPGVPAAIAPRHHTQHRDVGELGQRAELEAIERRVCRVDIARKETGDGQDAQTRRSGHRLLNPGAIRQPAFVAFPSL